MATAKKIIADAAAEGVSISGVRLFNESWWYSYLRRLRALEPKNYQPQMFEKGSDIPEYDAVAWLLSLFTVLLRTKGT